MNQDLLRQWLPIGVSVLSLSVASLALGWNVYRDVVLRARVRVKFAVVSMVTPGIGTHGHYLNITVTNHGPGQVKIDGISGRTSPLWRTLLRRPQHFIILPDHTNPLSGRLPTRLDVGETLNLLLPHDELLSESVEIGGRR